MKIAAAMKKVSRIGGELKVLKERMAECLTTIDENEYPDVFSSLLEKYDEKSKDLVRLKVAVMTANIQGQKFETILKLGELKSKIEFLRNLDPKQGFHVNRVFDSSSAVKYKSQITLSEKNDMIEKCQEEINKLTDELDEFNAVTNI